jgi:hypothetical protein
VIEDEKYLIKIQERTAGKALGSVLDTGQIEQVIGKNILAGSEDIVPQESNL